MLSFAVLILLGGKLGDRFGRKRIFLVGLAVFTLSSAACALSTTSDQLIAARVAQGVGAAMLNPLSLSIIVNAFPRKQLPTAIGMWAGISGLGLAIGPLLGGFLTENVSWSAVFWINVPIGIIAAAACLYAVDESRDPAARSLDIVGTVLVTAGMFSLIWALIETSSHSWTSAYTLGLPGRLGRRVRAVPDLGVARPRSDDPALVLQGARVRRGRGGRDAGRLRALRLDLLPGALLPERAGLLGPRGRRADAADDGRGIVCAPIAGKLNARVGPRPLMTIGMLLATVGLFGLSRMGLDTSYNAIWPFFVLLGAGISMTMPTTASTAMGAVEQTKSGIASGVVNASRQVGGALGIAVLGSIGATIAANHWHGSEALTELVVGGQGSVIGQVAGPEAQAQAYDAWLNGMQGAMLVGSGLTLLAALLAYVGLRGVRSAHATAPAAVAVEA